MTRDQLIEYMEQWRRDCFRKEDGGTGWHRQVMLGKVMDGMPGTDCPRCKDAVTGASTGSIYIAAPGIAKQKVVCPVCDGAKRVKVDASPNKVNPALISGNIPAPHFDVHPMSVTIDRIVCAMKDTDAYRSLYFVIYYHYLRNGTQEQKAMKIGISQGHFSRLLGEAHDYIMSELA